MPETRKLTFDDIAKLTDREIQMTWREVDTVDLATALIGAKKAVRERSYANVSERVGKMIKEEVEYRRPLVDKAQVEEVRGRIADVMNTLMDAGMITLPAEGHKKMKLTKDKEAKRKTADRATRPVHEMSYEDIDALIVGLAEVARMEGILALDSILDGMQDRLMATGFRLAVDGTEPSLVLSILEAHQESLVREYSIKLRKVVEGVMAIQSGDNPRIIEQKLGVIY